MILIQGENTVLSVPVIKDGYTTLTGSTKIRAAIIIKGQIEARFQDITLETAIEGYGELNINSSNSNIVDLNITSEISSKMSVGDAIIRVAFTDDVDYVEVEVLNALTIKKGYILNSL